VRILIYVNELFAVLPEVNAGDIVVLVVKRIEEDGKVVFPIVFPFWAPRRTCSQLNHFEPNGMLMQIYVIRKAAIIQCVRFHC
jgi:hypothetical protein